MELEDLFGGAPYFSWLFFTCRTMDLGRVALGHGLWLTSCWGNGKNDNYSTKTILVF